MKIPDRTRLIQTTDDVVRYATRIGLLKAARNPDNRDRRFSEAGRPRPFASFAVRAPWGVRSRTSRCCCSGWKAAKPPGNGCMIGSWPVVAIPGKRGHNATVRSVSSTRWWRKPPDPDRSNARCPR